MRRPRQGTNDVKQQTGCFDMTERLRGDGVMRSAAGGMIIVIREANETGTLTFHLALADTRLSLLTFHFLEMMHLYFTNVALQFLPSAQTNKNETWFCFW